MIKDKNVSKKSTVFAMIIIFSACCFFTGFGSAAVTNLYDEYLGDYSNFELAFTPSMVYRENSYNNPYTATGGFWLLIGFPNNTFGGYTGSIDPSVLTVDSTSGVRYNGGNLLIGHIPVGYNMNSNQLITTPYDYVWIGLETPNTYTFMRNTSGPTTSVYIMENNYLVPVMRHSMNGRVGYAADLDYRVTLDLSQYVSNGYQHLSIDSITGDDPSGAGNFDYYNIAFERYGVASDFRLQSNSDGTGFTTVFSNTGSIDMTYYYPVYNSLGDPISYRLIITYMGESYIYEWSADGIIGQPATPTPIPTTVPSNCCGDICNCCVSCGCTVGVSPTPSGTLTPMPTVTPIDPTSSPTPTNPGPTPAPTFPLGVPTPNPTPVPPQPAIDARLLENDPSYFNNISGYLTYWNGEMGWGLNSSEIEQIANELENMAEVPASELQTKTALSSMELTEAIHRSSVLQTDQLTSSSLIVKEGEGYFVSNMTAFREEIGRIIELNDVEVQEFNMAEIEQREEMRMLQRTEQKKVLESVMYTKDGDMYSLMSSSSDLPPYVDPATHPAPYAYGNIYHLYVLVNFEDPGSDGNWDYTDAIDALYDAFVGMYVIQQQAPSQANLVYNGGYYVVTVSGSNTGDQSAWYADGWMQEALYNIGFRGENEGELLYGYVADTFIEEYNADAFVIIFFTHDDKGGYAIGNTLYPDQAAVSYWGNGPENNPRDVSIAGSYAHETLHLFGAPDEYEGSSDYMAVSGQAVSPMNQWYRNANHINMTNNPNYPNAPDYIDSIMNQHRNFLTISDSSRNFIGWGDYDNDGRIDVLDLMG